MSKYIEGNIDTKQYSFLPMCYDEIISEDNPVRLIDVLVDSLDLAKLNFANTNRDASKAGRPAYNPKDMLKLYLYGYFNGIRSSRKLEKECHRNIEIFWLIKELKPDFKTIAEFRRNNINNMKNVFTEFSLLCDSMGLYGKEIVAIDGSKFRASNARRKNYTKGKVEKQIKYYQEIADKYIQLLNEEDKNESENKIKVSSEEMKAKISNAQKRIEELIKLKEDIEKNGEKSITDPDSRHMKANNNGTDIAHNVQIAVDNKNHLVAAVDVTSNPADQGQLYTMAEKAKDALGVDKITALADKGYWKGEDLKECENNGIEAIVSVPEEMGNEGYKKSNFKYNAVEDCYVCPNGEKLTRGNRKALEYTNSKACKACPYRDKCTKNKQGKKIVRNENQEYMDRAKNRQEEKMELYKERQKIVEHVFGTVKRALGYTHFLLRGNSKVKGESFIHFLIYNIKRVCNIVTLDDIIEAIKRNRVEKVNINFLFYSLFFLKSKLY